MLDDHLNNGRGGLLLCLAVWATTAFLGLGVLLVRKGLSCSCLSSKSKEGPTEERTFRKARVRNESEQSAALDVRERIVNLLGNFHRAEQNLKIKPSFVPMQHSFDDRLFRILNLYCAFGLTLYEAYIKICRESTDEQIPSANINFDCLRPAIQRQEELSDLTDHLLEAVNSGLKSDSQLQQALGLAEAQVKLWSTLLEENPQLNLWMPQDGRLDAGWDHRGASRSVIEENLTEHMSFAEMRQAGFLPPLPEMNSVQSVRQRILRWFPSQIHRHPRFYAAIAVLYCAVLAPFVMGVGKSSWRGLFGTFLPVPPQYCIDCFQDGSGVEIQRILVPLLYGVMHTAMLSLCLMPIPLCKGLLRDFTNAGPTCRGIFPIEDSVWLHKSFGVLMIGALFVGAMLWLIAMGSTCAGLSTDNEKAIKLACTAFAPPIFDARAGPIGKTNNVSQHVIMTDLLFDSIRGANFFDFRDNVMALRIVAWICFFGISPWIVIRSKTKFGRWVPRWVARNWFELVTYSHIIVAWVALALTLYARFEVFFFALLSWGLLVIDKIRERLCHSFTTPIYYGESKSSTNYVIIHRSETDGRPTAIEVVVKRPKNFKYSAGQYVFVTIPALGPTPHAFSLASCPDDESLHFHMGVQSGCEIGTANNWITDGTTWDQTSPSWTFSLCKEILRLLADKETSPINAIVRGPYGSPFQRCFTASQYATVLVGQGTGLTSALSVLKHVISRRLKGERTSERVWFVWTCRTVRDLQWCWRTLQQTLIKACAKNAITLPDDWSPATSSTLDWLGVSIFVSKADEAKLLSFLGYGEDVGKERDFEYVSPQIPEERLNEVELGGLRRAPSYIRPPTYSPPGSPTPISRARCNRPSRRVTLLDHVPSRSVSHVSVRSDRAGAVADAEGEAFDAEDRKQESSVLTRVLSRRRYFSLGEEGPDDDDTYVWAQERATIDNVQIKQLIARMQASTGVARREAEDDLIAALKKNGEIQRQADISAWLKEQVIPARLDNKGADVRNLLQNLKTLGGPQSRISVCVCSGYTFAQSIHSMCDQMGCEFESLAHAE
eukprot:m.148590 g.148590  ORF g.148590 m.148590 type:complete len:1059 (+) comp14216_c0_seq2:141-3317(+)